MVTGKIHSIETCGTVDGPGIRYVIFTQGCPLRCQYCHNPDTWKLDNGKSITTSELIEDIIKYKSYMKFSKGGVTASGGDPLLQPEFVKDLFKRCQEEGIHTALDTSGFIDVDTVKDVLEYTDLVLLDIKNMDPKRYTEITKVSLAPTLKFANYLKEINKPLWVRYVLVPGLSDNIDAIKALGEYLQSFDNLEKLEILPFHKMGEYKWEELGYKYTLSETKEPDKNLLDEVIDLLNSYDLPVQLH
ncbi:pyruvate formate-lyase-activating protein [Vallitalea okinawensis]|uniref:pyruvate formate-lyase-activating protein n=1 Tax=Vallitalea okinawensis TaxID=2078660 RepID=UPI000CFC5451|nr:pyruvate formate-lyase-activating protein [Vallitalea okinawensis]